VRGPPGSGIFRFGPSGGSSTARPGPPVTGYVIKASPGSLQVTTAAVTNFLVGGLTNGRKYQFTVAAVNSDGTGPASIPSTAVTPRAPTAPGPVNSVKASAGFRQASVSWLPPSSDGGAPITGYRVTVTPGTVHVSVAGDIRSATISGLQNGQSYKLLVAAVNATGQGAAASSLSVTPHATAPGAPVSVTASPGLSGITVAWRPPATNGGSSVTGYLVTVVGTTRKIKTAATARSVTVTGLTSGTSYTFTVAAGNTRGFGPAVTSLPATAGGAVAPQTVVLSAASLAALTQVESDGSLIFSSPPAQVTDLAPGDVVVAGVGAATPAGFLATVADVSSAGSTVRVATTPASLDDALSEAGFGTSTSLTQAEVATFTAARPGVRLLPATSAPASAPVGSISLSLKTTLYKDTNGRTISVAGSITLTPSVSFSASITCCVHTASKFTGSLTATASLDVKAEVSHEIEGGYTLGRLKFEPIAFDVLGVPIVILPTLTVKLTAKGTVTAGLTAGAGESVTLGAHVSTSDGHVTAQPFSSRTTTYTAPTVYGSTEAAGGVEADLSTIVDGLPGPTLTDTLWLAELSVDPTQQPWWTLSLENVLSLDYKLELLQHTLAKFSATLLDNKVMLAHATDPYQGISITPNPALVAPGGQLQLSAQVAGVTAQQVTWNAPAGNGAITAAGLYTAPSAPGTYDVTAQSNASGLKPAAVGLIGIQVGDQPPGPPTQVAATSPSYGAASLTWDVPADSGGGAITDYTITADPGGQTYDAGAATSDTITGLDPGGTYTFTVDATSDGGTGQPSAPSSPVVINDAGLVVSDMTTGITAQGMASALAGPGVTVSNDATFAGADVAGGQFAGGSGIIGFGSGDILSTGTADAVAGSPQTGAVSTDNGQAGDSDLDALLGYATYDAAALQFSFTPTASNISLSYVFGSSEYDYYSGTIYNDGVGIYIDGQNCAAVPADSSPVSIDDVNATTNSQYYIDNDPNYVANPLLATTLHGVTTAFTCTASVTPNVSHMIKIVIADASDSALDADVFLASGSLRSSSTAPAQKAPTVPGKLRATPLAHPHTAPERTR
jgi:hypothetical protein